VSATVLLWFRRDLRLADNPALSAAIATGKAVIPVYVWSPADDGVWPPGGASRAWLSRSLSALDAHLRVAGSRLLVVQGNSDQEIPRLASALSATAVFANRRHEPTAAAVDARVETILIEKPDLLSPLRSVAAVRSRRPAHAKRRPLPGVHAVLAGLPGNAVAARPPARASALAFAQALATVAVAARLAVAS